jgi:hypothetical protein
MPHPSVVFIDGDPPEQAIICHLQTGRRQATPAEVTFSTISHLDVLPLKWNWTC